jgi:hypothetical protein
LTNLDVSLHRGYNGIILSPSNRGQMSISIQKRTNEIKNVLFYINFFFKYTYINPIVPRRKTQFSPTTEIRGKMGFIYVYLKKKLI